MTRNLARSFRALARKCVSGRARGPAPSIVCIQKDGAFTLWVRTPDAELTHTTPTSTPDEALVVPMALFDAVAGPGNDPVTIEAEGDAGVARWNDRGVPQTFAFTAAVAGPESMPPNSPEVWHPIPPTFLAALHECGRSTAADSPRFALERVQLRGKLGQVIATDSKVALFWSGFAFPFTDDWLVPAIPIFGSRVFAGMADVLIGTTEARLSVALGPWQVSLLRDTTGRYPDVASAMPKSATTVVSIDEADAALLLDRLPVLPGAGDENQPVTLDLAEGVAIRGRDSESGATASLRLECSSVVGPVVRLVLDRQRFARALSLGCFTLKVAAADKPIAAEGPNRTFVLMTLDPALAVAPESPLESKSVLDSRSPRPLRSSTMKSHETNGNGHPGRADPVIEDPIDPLVEAETLRTHLAEASASVSRLIVQLKAGRKEKRVLATVWSNLKALNLGSGGPP